MKLRTKIFLLAIVLVLGIMVFGSSFLNYEISKTITMNIGENFRDARLVFEKLFSSRQQELALRTRLLSDLPKLKAAISTQDENTIDRELSELAGFNPSIDLFVIADSRNSILAFTFKHELRKNDEIKTALEKYIEKMNSLSDLWVIDNKLFLISAQQVVFDNTAGNAGPGFFIILGQHIDNSFSDELKSLTHTDINIGDLTLYASTFSMRNVNIDILKAINNYKKNAPFEYMNSRDPNTVILYFAGKKHLAQFGDLQGQAQACYILSRPYDREVIILNQIRRNVIQISVLSVVIVFIFSFIGARYLTDPLKKLIESTKAIASGNYEFSSRMSGSVRKHSYEIKSLSDSFDAMSRAVQENIQMVTDLNVELSEKNVELEEALNELKRVQAELIKSEKLSALGKMAGSIIHDFKSPMQVIKGNAELIAYPKVSDEKKVKLLSNIKEAVNQMNQMTYEILDFVRGETNLFLEKTRISHIIGELLIHLQTDIETAGITVKKDVGYDPDIRLDRLKMRRVLENIVRNAIEAADGAIEIGLHTRQEENSVRLEISDTGPGMDKELLKKIFDLFVTQGKKKGTGLGLAITKKLIEDHKGTVDVRSAPGKGTTFIITLPVGTAG